MRKPVLTLFYQFNPWNSSIGGIQTIVRSFIKYAPLEIDIRLVGTGVGDPQMQSGQWHSTEFANRKLEFFPLFDLSEDDNVRRLLPTSVRYTLALLKRDLSSDFMHFHRLEPAIAALRWQGHKMMYIHNDIHQKFKAANPSQSTLWRRFPWLYFSLEKLLISQFDAILSCNSESTQLYKELYPDIAQRISYVRNAVDDEIFYSVSSQSRNKCRQELAHELALSPESQFFLFAGRLHPQKDPLLLVQAVKLLQNSTAHLLIAGEGELASALRKEITRLNLTNRVSLLGAVNQTRLSTLYRAANAFVLSSVYEGLPVVALESLACGTPVITTRAGDTPNLLTLETGIVCDQRSAEAIAQAMETLLNCPEHYPPEACTQAAKPYCGRQVIGRIYADILQLWEQQVIPPPRLRTQLDIKF